MSDAARAAVELLAASRALRVALEDEDATPLRCALARRETALLQLMACAERVSLDSEARSALREAAALDAESVGRARRLRGELEQALAEIGLVRTRLARLALGDDDAAPQVRRTA